MRGLLAPQSDCILVGFLYVAVLMDTHFCIDLSLFDSRCSTLEASSGVDLVKSWLLAVGCNYL